MSKRTIVLLVVAIAVWGGVFYLLWFSPWAIFGKGEAEPRNQPKKVIRREKLTPKVIVEYVSIVKEGLKDVDLFKPRKLGLSESDLNDLIISSGNVIPNMEFVGYIIDEKESRIILRYSGKEFVFRRDELIFGKYLVIHVSSVGAVVLDLEKGGMGIIR